MINYTIGITTYSYRFDKFLIDLVKDIRKDNQNELILAINGNYKEIFDEEYRKRILDFSTKYEKIFPFIYPNFRSLSKLWNNIVINSSNEYILILNDDVTILNSSFWKIVQTNIEKYETTFTFDSTFCHYVIKRDELNNIGWFDERYLGIGWEDIDFINRYKKYYNKDVLNINDASGIKRYVEHDNVIVNQRKGSSTFNKYSEFNREMNIKKLQPIQQYPYEKFYWDNYDKL